MIIDCILDRQDSPRTPYNPADFYRNLLAYGDVGEDISRAMDSGTEDDVKEALRAYIITNDYNPAICAYINSQNWLN
jgi:hypothetical protein